MNRDHVLQVENLTMQFGGVVAVNNLSLEVNRGEIVALIGPNGAGKTTAFNCITGVYQPTNGIVRFEDRPIVVNHPQGKMKKEYAGKNAEKYVNEKVLAPTPDIITKMGVARTFQNIRLWKSMTVFENVLIAKHMRAKQNVFSAALRTSKKEELRMREETETLLKEQDLWDVRDELATGLPYGKQRRLEIARALATDPKLLLLDEPAAGMNPQESHELMEFIRLLKKQGYTVLMIEHDMSVVMNISDRIYVIDQGRPIAEGLPEEIAKNQKVIDVYLGGSNNAAKN